MSDPTAPPKPAYKPGDVLVVAAPASSGLPLNARAIVASVNKYDGVQHKYDVTLTGGGARGSDVQFVRGVAEGWLRSEGRIATAKSCNVLPFGTFARTAPRLLVPLFQRRYCWVAEHWARLWRDVALGTASALAPHAIGRVTIARDRKAVLVVDGQQRCTTMMLLLAAVRDEARAADAARADPLIAAVDAILLHRPKLRDNGAAAGAAEGPAALALEQASVGLESLDHASQVRLVPSREDRLRFCALVLGAPFDRNAGASARRLSACYDHFRNEARELVARQCGYTDSGGGSGAEAVSALASVVDAALRRVTVVAFELQDGVALQTIYDMLAQRERALTPQFSSYTGQQMAESDLVRNLLLAQLEESRRLAAYEEYWLIMERAQGDGDAAVLEAFLAGYLEERRAEAPPAKAAAPAASPLLEGTRAAARARRRRRRGESVRGGRRRRRRDGGGRRGDGARGARAAGGIEERATATTAAAPREAVAVAPPDLWAPEAVLARAQAAQLRE